MSKILRYSILFMLTSVCLTTGLLSGCAGAGTPASTEKEQTIRIPYVQWACAEAESHIAQVLLEDMGYNVELSTVQAAVMWSSVATGDSDVFTTAWLPYTHASYWEEYGNDVERLGAIYDEAVLAIVVPDYVTINSIAEMKDHESEFQGCIVGIDPGAGIMEATRNVTMPTYGMEDWTLVESSESGMLSELERAMSNEEWVAVTGWAPHWKFFAYDLKMLEDPEETLGGMEEIVVIARKGFTEDFPEAAEFFRNWKINSAQLGEVMYMINIDNLSPSDAARSWIEANPDVVDSWIQ